MASQELDLDDRVVEYLMQTVSFPADVDMGRQDSSGPGIVYVVDPAQEVVAYFNGRKKRTYAFTLMAKLSKWSDALNTLNAINRTMERAKPVDIKSNNGSFAFLSAQMTSNPSFKQAIEDDGVTYSIYAASFQVKILIN